MRKPGQVLVELLILLVLAGLLLSFVGRVRESANQMNCRNNLRQIGLAVNSYHDTYGLFPLAALSNDQLPVEKRLSWLFGIDPHMEARMDPDWHKGQSKAWDAPENRKLLRIGARNYRCPASAVQKLPDGACPTHYVGIAGVGADAAWLPASDARAGVFGFHRRLKESDIKDGLAVTLLAVETDWEIGPWVAAGPATTRGLDPDRRPYLGVGRPFGGLHRGGGMVAFADASVCFVREAIEPQVLEALATVAGGEEIDLLSLG